MQIFLTFQLIRPGFLTVFEGHFSRLVMIFCTIDKDSFQMTFLLYFSTDAEVLRFLMYLGILYLGFSWGNILFGAVFSSSAWWFFLVLIFGVFYCVYLWWRDLHIVAIPPPFFSGGLWLIITSLTWLVVRGNIKL